MRTLEELRDECVEAGLPEGSRVCEICAGAVFDLDVTNGYRAKWGLDALDPEEVLVAGPPRPRPTPTRVPRRKPRPKEKRKKPRRDLGSPAAKSKGCGGCGKKKVKAPKPTGSGPGSMLMRIMEQAGVPHCEACVELAGRMDRWGRSGCRRRMEQIVKEIMPRAKDWIANSRPIMHRLLSITRLEDRALRSAIRRKVSQAINLAKERPRVRARPPKPIHRADDVSNVLESTVIKPPVWIKGQHPHVEHRPFQVEPTRHLLYHVYPRKNEIWRWNVELLLPHLPLFNGRRIVAIATDDATVDAEEVKDAFRGEVLEFMVFRNNKTAGEMVSFLPLLAHVQTDDPDVVTFRAHAKGTNRFERDRRDHLREWTELLYTVNLGDWEQVRRDLEEAAMTGACRKFDQFRKRAPRGKPSYSGSFYWFRNCYVYSRKWQDVDNPRWGCESWPSRLFKKEETRCLFLDDTKSMYDPDYWNTTVRPQYRRWKQARGIQ